jgi:hypothetical protein
MAGRELAEQPHRVKCGAERTPSVHNSGVIQLAFGDGPCGRQGRVPFDINLGQAELGLRLRKLASCLRQLSVSLIQRGLKHARIDFEQNLVLSDERSFPDSPV